MQKGFATLEIVFAIMIIAVLLSVTIPNTARVIDRAALDYESKKFYSDLRFLQATGRSGTFDTTGTGKSEADTSPSIKLAPNRHSWQILRGNTPIREEHFFGDRIWLSTNGDSEIAFNSLGRSKSVNMTITLTPRFGKANTIVFDSVGRFTVKRDDD